MVTNRSRTGNRHDHISGIRGTRGKHGTVVERNIHVHAPWRIPAHRAARALGDRLPGERLEHLDRAGAAEILALIGVMVDDEPRARARIVVHAERRIAGAARAVSLAPVARVPGNGMERPVIPPRMRTTVPTLRRARGVPA